MRKLMYVLFGMTLSISALAGERVVDTERFFGETSGRAIRKCEKARDRDYRCDSSQYRCSPCSRNYQANHSTYNVYKRSSYGSNHDYDYDYDYDNDYDKVERSCTVIEVERRRVIDSYTRSARAYSSTRAKDQACEKAMRLCRDRKHYGTRCVKRSEYKSHSKYDDFDAALDIVGGVLELLD